MMTFFDLCFAAALVISLVRIYWTLQYAKDHPELIAVAEALGQDPVGGAVFRPFVVALAGVFWIVCRLFFW